MKKRIFFMLSVLLLAGLVPLTAGGKQAAPAPSGGEQSKYAKHLTISTTVIDAEKTGKSAKDKWIFDKFNIGYNFIAVTWGDWNEKTRAMIAGDDIPDVLWWDMKLNNTAEFKVWAEAGAFREIAQADIDKRPNLKALQNRLVSDDQILTVNGKLYGWPVARALEPYMQSTQYMHYIYRRDWAKAVGLYKEGDVYTWDEAKALIDAVKRQDPGKNGAGNTIGITNEGWAFPGLYMQLLALSPDKGNGYLDRNTYIETANGYVPYFTTPNYREELKFVADLYRRNYIWRDQMSLRGNEGIDMFRSGRAFMYCHNGGPSFLNSNIYPQMTTNGTIKDPQDVGPMLILSPKDNATYMLIEVEDYWSVAHFRHDLDNDKYERILDMWDWLASEDGRAWKEAGIPDVDYKRTGPTDIQLLWPKAGDGRWISPYSDFSYRYADPPTLSLFYQSQADQAGFISYASAIDIVQNKKYNFKIQAFDWDRARFASPLYNQFGGFQTQSEEFERQVLASSENVDTMMDRWLREMEPRWKPVADELNKAYFKK
jgi:ABC-type glycerol-3-phosphate transport system substrate-binding protein